MFPTELCHFRWPPVTFIAILAILCLNKHTLFLESLSNLSGVARGGGGWGVQTPSITSKAIFFHSRKVTVIKYYNLSNDSKNN